MSKIVKYIIKRHDGKYVGKSGRPCITTTPTMEFDIPESAQNVIDLLIDDSFSYSARMYISPEEHDSKPFSEWRVLKKTTEITVDPID